MRRYFPRPLSPADDMLGRVTAIKEGTTAHATYSYFGSERRVRAVVVNSSTLDYAMLVQTGEAVGDAGDRYGCD